MTQPPDRSLKRKDFWQAALVNPEVYCWLGVLVLGGAAAGWFLIGAGVLLALVPLMVLALLARRVRRNEQKWACR